MHFELARIYRPSGAISRAGRTLDQRGCFLQPEQVCFLTLTAQAMAKQSEEMQENAGQIAPGSEIKLTSTGWADHTRRPGSYKMGFFQDGNGRMDGVAGGPGVITGRACVIRGRRDSIACKG
jgi:hypothetical protein